MRLHIEAAAFAVGVAMLAMQPMPARAQNLPQGSYLHTCSNVRMVDSVLTATCLTADQSPRDTSLPNPYACQDVVNSNGRLVCGGAASAYYPGGDNTTRSRGGMARFTDQCSGNTFVVIRVAGSPGDLIRFELKNGHTVHFDLPPGSTYALQCGGYVGPNGNYSYLNVE